MLSLKIIGNIFSGTKFLDLNVHVNMNVRVTGAFSSIFTQNTEASFIVQFVENHLMKNMIWKYIVNRMIKQLKKSKP